MLLAAVLACSACASSPRIDATKCKAQGGNIERVGMFATPTCVVPYADADKPCSDKSDCLGMCMIAPDAVIGSAATGACQKNSKDYFGCYNEVRAGIVVGGMCWD